MIAHLRAGCACLFDDAGHLVAPCWAHTLKAERDKAEADAKDNAPSRNAGAE